MLSLTVMEKQSLLKVEIKVFIRFLIYKSFFFIDEVFITKFTYTEVSETKLSHKYDIYISDKIALPHIL